MIVRLDKKARSNSMFPVRNTLGDKDTDMLRDGKKIYHANTNENIVGVVILISKSVSE